MGSDHRLNIMLSDIVIMKTGDAIKPFMALYFGRFRRADVPAYT